MSKLASWVGYTFRISWCFCRIFCQTHSWLLWMGTPTSTKDVMSSKYWCFFDILIAWYLTRSNDDEALVPSLSICFSWPISYLSSRSEALAWTQSRISALNCDQDWPKTEIIDFLTIYWIARQRTSCISKADQIYTVGKRLFERKAIHKEWEPYFIVD